MEFIAWVGSILLAVCAVPQAIKSFKEKNADSLSALFLIFWGVGEVLVLIYVTDLRDWALMFNYSANVVLIVIIARYKFWPKYEDEHIQNISN